MVYIFEVKIRYIDGGKYIHNVVAKDDVVARKKAILLDIKQFKKAGGKPLIIGYCEIVCRGILD